MSSGDSSCLEVTTSSTSLEVSEGGSSILEVLVESPDISVLDSDCASITPSEVLAEIIEPDVQESVIEIPLSAPLSITVDPGITSLDLVESVGELVESCQQGPVGPQGPPGSGGLPVSQVVVLTGDTTDIVVLPASNQTKYYRIQLIVEQPVSDIRIFRELLIGIESTGIITAPYTPICTSYGIRQKNSALNYSLNVSLSGNLNNPDLTLSLTNNTPFSLIARGLVFSI